MIEKIEFRNLKATPLQLIDLTDKPLSLIIGANGSGKTSIIDAIELAVTGCHADVGSQNKLLAGFITDGCNEMVAAVTIGGCEASLTLTRKGKTTSKKHEPGSVNLPSVLIRADEVLTLSDAERAKWVFRNYGSGGLSFDEFALSVYGAIGQGKFSEGGAKVRDGIWGDIQEIAEEMPESPTIAADWMNATVKHVGEAKRAVAANLNTLQHTASMDVVPDRAEDPGAELGRIRGEIGSVNASIQDCKLQVSRNLDLIKRIEVYEKVEPEAGLAKDQKSISELEHQCSEIASVIESAQKELIDMKGIPSALKDATVSFLNSKVESGDEASTATRWIQELEDSFVSTREKVTKLQRQMADQSALLNKWRSEQRVKQGELGRWQAIISIGESLKGGLTVVDLTKDNDARQKELELLDRELEAYKNRQTTLVEQAKKFGAYQQFKSDTAQRSGNIASAGVRLDVLKTMEKSLKDFTALYAESVAVSILGPANAILDKTTGFSLSFNESKFVAFRKGYHELDQPSTNPIETLSGSERVIAEAALRVALARLVDKDCPRVVIIDELLRFDQENQVRVLTGLQAAHRAGLIDQAIVLAPWTTGDFVENWNVIAM